MSNTKHALRRKHRSKAAKAVLGAAGLSLSLAHGASAATGRPPAEVPARNAAVSHAALYDEEISDVSLATFYVWDKEYAPVSRLRSRMAFACAGGGCGCNGCAGCGGCAGCWSGKYLPPLFGGDSKPPLDVTKPVRKHAHGPKSR
jgi:hypothetical protein